MIIDVITNLRRYADILHVSMIAAFLDNTNLSAFSEGDIPIKGEELYVKVLRYVPKEPGENNFEIHTVYTDVQVIISGTEVMQIAPLASLQQKTDYDSRRDCQFFTTDKDISNIVVQKGQFIVFFPQEAHKPACRYHDYDTPVTKLVFKAKEHGSR